MTTSQERFNAGKRQNAAFFFPETAAWSDGVTRRFKVSDPTRLGAVTALEQQTDPLRASLRVVKIHPDDAALPAGSSVTSTHGLVVIGSHTDVGNLSGATTYVGRLIDARAYPTTASAGGSPFLLRIVALDAVSATASDLAATANNSHRALLPPGITLQPTDVITTGAGDQYRVVPPVQRDALGDTLGLSWMGTVTGRTPTPGNDPTPATPPLQTPDVDPWWEQT